MRRWRPRATRTHGSEHLLHRFQRSPRHRRNRRPADEQGWRNRMMRTHEVVFVLFVRASKKVVALNERIRQQVGTIHTHMYVGHRNVLNREETQTNSKIAQTYRVVFHPLAFVFRPATHVRVEFTGPKVVVGHVPVVTILDQVGFHRAVGRANPVFVLLAEAFVAKHDPIARESGTDTCV